jgi:endonuclease/exonuclease/phosphatase family metal-dependent hydrolase
VLTIGEFKHNNSGKKLVVMNTHLDDQGVIARQKSAEIIVDRTNALLASGKYDGALLTGDFNSEDKEEAYRTIQFANNSPFFDVEPLFDQKDARRQGHRNTFTVRLVMTPL